MCPSHCRASASPLSWQVCCRWHSWGSQACCNRYKLQFVDASRNAIGYKAVGRRWEYFFAAPLNDPPAKVRNFQQLGAGQAGGASINEASSTCCLRASLHFVQAVVPLAKKHPHRHPELRLSMLLCSGWRIQAHRCSCYRRKGSCRLPKTWLGRTGECFFCGSDCLSAAKTGPRQTVTRKHAERRAAGLARRHLAKQL